MEFIGKRASSKFIINNASGLSTELPTLPSGAIDYPAVIKMYDDQINEVKANLVLANKELTNARNRLSQYQQERGSCDMGAEEYAKVVFAGRWGEFASSNECYDQNNRNQDQARNDIATAEAKVKQLINQQAALQAEKEAALQDNRKQQIADTQAQTDRLKAQAGAAIAAGQVDPEVIKAKAELEAESGLTSNKKILYAGVVIFMVLVALVGAYMVVSKSKSI